MLRWWDKQILLDGSEKPFRPSKSIGMFKTRKEARIVGDEEMRKINTAIEKPQSRMSLEDFVDYHYFPHITTRLRPSTVHGYRRLWSDYKAFWTCDTKLRDFRTLDGDRILDRIHAAKGVSKNTLKNIKSFLSAVFKHARRTGVLDSANPMQDVSLPKSRGAKDTYAYSLEEVTAMLIRLPLRSAAVVAVAAFTGLRKGEIAALKWDNYRQGLLYVEQSKWRKHIDDPKTGKSKSPVPVIFPLAKILERWHQTIGDPKSEWMFGSNPLDADNFDDRHIKPFIDNWHGWHAFRRGLSTTLHRLGVPDKDTQQILRHANVRTTQESYIKTATTDAVIAMKMLETAVGLADLNQ
jgi:integrase